MGCSANNKARGPQEENLTITVGMAVYGDFGESAITIQVLRWSLSPINQIVIVDNNPNSRDGERFRSLAASANLTYVPFPEPRGTSAPRDKIFRHAIGDVVVVIDPHIIIGPQAIAALRVYAIKNPLDFGIWSGPRIGEDLKTVHSTHFEEVWGPDLMYGRWGVDPRGQNQRSEPFEIPGHGLGLFACRRKAWLGFPEGLKGFGGEELMIHEKFRQASRKSLCLPFLRWWHLFRDSSKPAPYPLTMEDRFRNYLIWYRHLGLDDAELIQKFRGSSVGRRVDRVIQAVDDLNVPRFDPTTIPDPTKPPDPSTLDGRFEIARRHPSDINEHCDTLKSLAKKCETVVEFGTRHAVSTVALLAGQPKRFISLDVNPSSEAEELRALAGATDYSFVVGSSLLADPVSCDMLFIDTIHTKEQVAGELARHAAGVRKYLVFHDTVIFGQRGEDGGPGIMEAIRDFLKSKDEWIVLNHFQNNNGLLVLSRDPADRRPLPPNMEMAGNFLEAAGRFIVNKGGKVTEDQLKERLEACVMCRHRNGQRCAECGCPLARKAPQIGEDCRLGLWPKLNVIEAPAIPATPAIQETPAESVPSETGESQNTMKENDCNHHGAIQSSVDFSTKISNNEADPPTYSITVRVECVSCGQRFSPVTSEVKPL